MVDALATLALSGSVARLENWNRAAHQLAVLRIAAGVGQQFRRVITQVGAEARRYHCCGVEYGSRKIVRY